MKYVIYLLFAIIGIAIGLIIGFGFFEGYELILGLFILFPLLILIGMLIWRNKVRKSLDMREKEIKSKDRFSKWEN